MTIITFFAFYQFNGLLLLLFNVPSSLTSVAYSTLSRLSPLKKLVNFWRTDFLLDLGALSRPWSCMPKSFARFCVAKYFSLIGFPHRNSLRALVKQTQLLSSSLYADAEYRPDAILSFNQDLSSSTVLSVVPSVTISTGSPTSPCGNLNVIKSFPWIPHKLTYRCQKCRHTTLAIVVLGIENHNCRMWNDIVWVDRQCRKSQCTVPFVDLGEIV